MSISLVLLVVGALLQFFLGSLWYVRDALLGRSKPNRMTFLIWAAGPFIGVAAGVTTGGGWALLPVFMAGFGPLAIFLASFWNPEAYWKLGVLDYVCGVVAVAALVALFFVHQPLVALALAIFADGLATFPTLLKAWRYPETETGRAYVASFANVCIGLAVVGSYTFASAGFLFYLFVSDGALVIATNRQLFVARR
ncbi:MAG: hypothetical protein KGI73_02855 [Patescibacteria group bacterium]|nr:hypothetical protein [Patescibacteria group bacterium]